MIEWISHVSHHLGSLLSDIELIILCAFVCKVGYFDAQIRETIIQVGVLTYLPFSKKVTKYLERIKVRNNLHSSSFPLLHL